MAERPPPKLAISEPAELLEWFEENLCEPTLKDPRGHRVAFDIGRFPYMVKLLDKEGTKLKKPMRAAAAIKRGELTRHDFGGMDAERAQTLSWIPATVLRPTFIARNNTLSVPGDELYIKEFDKPGYRYKVLICKRMSGGLLVPVTSYPREKIGRLTDYLLWP